MIRTLVFIVAMVSSFALVASSISIAQIVFAQQIAMDVNRPAGDKPFGGEKIGTVTIIPNGHVVNIVASMSSAPDQGKVWEAWFVDAGGSGYKLSLGEFAK